MNFRRGTYAAHLAAHVICTDLQMYAMQCSMLSLAIAHFSMIINGLYIQCVLHNTG